MKTNEELQKDVQDAIKWEPLLNAAEIGVTVKEGVVSLTGTVDAYAKKVEAENAVKKVKGVKAVVEEIKVKYDNWAEKTDEEIANEILFALDWNWKIPKDKVTVKVENRGVTLEGEVNWNAQRDAAKTVAANCIDVKYVTNNITIKSETKDKVEKLELDKAFKLSWLLEDKNILVNVVDDKVKLHGNVMSWYQKDEAGRIAWNAPGVVSVNNEITIDYL